MVVLVRRNGWAEWVEPGPVFYSYLDPKVDAVGVEDEEWQEARVNHGGLVARTAPGER